MLILIVAGILGVRWYQQYSGASWAQTDAVPEVIRLMATSRPLEALDMLRRAEQFTPGSPELVRLKEDLVVHPLLIETQPPAAQIYVRDYSDTEKDESHWRLVGESPLNTNLLPRGYYRIRAVKAGFVTVEVARGVTGADKQAMRLTLHAVADTPPDMVWVGNIEAGSRGTAVTFPAVLDETAPGFWLDRHEVTNGQFQKFVDAGGYQMPEYWKHSFVKDGRELSFQQAMSEFRDATGKPGPAGWELGTFPEGKADLPVGGVSWYEAAAYAEFAGKSLPTVFHWFRAAAISTNPDIIKASNFDGNGAARVESYSGLGPFGTLDMAGNLKEWAFNPVDDRRYILGGGWSDPTYFFARPDAKQPFDRQPTYGFRCAKAVSEVPEEMLGAVPFTDRDRRNDKPVDDSTFQTYKAFHAYDKTDLAAKTDATEEAPYWRKEKVSYQAAYGNERVIAYLYLPKNAQPPYQITVFFGGTTVLAASSLDDEYAMQSFGFIVRSGRAVLAPAFKGTLDRGPGAYYHMQGQPDRWREMNLQWYKDLGRSIDYLETRPDIDVGKLAFQGLSMGSAIGPRLLAVEPRIKVALLFLGGSFEKVSPEVDAWNFAPRVTIPVLMLNGKDDFLFPLETSQKPLFNLLGTPAKDKRHIFYEGGHGWNSGTRLEVVKDALDWLDRYLGEVKTK